MRIGIVGDVHAPFAHPMYRRFVQDTFEAWGVKQIVFIGDIIDHHALGFWEHDPNGHSAEGEAVLAALQVEKWYDLFPKARICIGNHDERHFRRARKDGIPDRYLRSYAEIWNTPKWDWQLSFRLDDVRYQHGTGSSGKDAAMNQAVQRRTSLVQGHTHSWAGVKWHANDTSRIFGMNAGCGIDVQSYAMAYGKDFAIRPVLGCGIVIDGKFPYFEPMPCGVGEKYHKSRAPKKERVNERIRS